jgi:putative glutamine amidotransferase
MPRPFIGITQPSNREYPTVAREILNREAYHRAIRQAGGTPIPITPTEFQSQKNFLNGIVLSGGGDINPVHYGDPINKFISGTDDTRDTFELEVFRWVVKRNIPVLGICRGMQLINVAQGGSLFYDLSSQQPGFLQHDWHPSRRLLAHKVSMDLNNPLLAACFPQHFFVNSLHHQGIRVIGKGLSPIARSPDGVIEALQLTGLRFGLAVQWHPEWLTDQQPTCDLFITFIHACEQT